MANKFWPAGKNFVAAAISLHSTCSGQISAPDRRASAKSETERDRKRGGGRAEQGWRWQRKEIAAINAN